MAIQLFVPTFDIDACMREIRECLEKGWTGLGYKTVQFEAEWKAYSGHEYAHFLNSATSGLHLAVNLFREAEGWKDGDEIITTPLTFVSTNHAILYENLKPVFADVDEYLCLDPADVERKITPRTRAVLFVGIGGNTGRFGEIKSLCAKKGLKLILDAAHMAGTRLDGATPMGDCTVYSFQAVKNLPSADAGMICFRDASLDEVARKKSWLGINKDTYSRTTSGGTYKWHYEVEHVGFKYHGNSITAAMCIAQLPHLDRDNAYRRQIAAWYEEGFDASNRIRVVPTAPGCESARHLFQVEVDRRDEVMLALNSVEIYPGVHYRDNCDYGMFSYAKGTCPRAHAASARVMSLPLHMRLTRKDIDHVIEQLRAVA